MYFRKRVVESPNSVEHFPILKWYAGFMTVVASDLRVLILIVNGTI